MAMPAARLTDDHKCPKVNKNGVPHVGGCIIGPCAPAVLIFGQPAARVNDKAVCLGPMDKISTGAPNVLIYGLPAARQGDVTDHNGVITEGCPTVLIG